MANTLPGTPYVESSDLVANYPAVSESLAERIDEVGVLPFADSTARGTALPTPTEGQYSYLQDTNSTEYWDGAAWVAAGTAPGIEFISATTFTAVTSISLDNIFTSSYKNYRIMANITPTVNIYLDARLRASGSDIIGANYFGSYAASNLSTLSGVSFGSQTKFTPLSLILPQGSIHCYDFFSPQLAAPTFYVGESHSRWGASNQTSSYNGGGSYQDTAQADGLTMLVTSGTITGEIIVYGYKTS